MAEHKALLRNEKNRRNTLRKRFSATSASEPLTPTTPTTPGLRGSTGVRLSTLQKLDRQDSVFVDEKLKSSTKEPPHVTPPPCTPGTLPSQELAWHTRRLRLKRWIWLALIISALLVSAAVIGVWIFKITTDRSKQTQLRERAETEREKLTVEIHKRETFLGQDCVPLEFAPCKGLGYTHFSLLFGNVTSAEEYFRDFIGNVMTSKCTSDLTLFCTLAFPPCPRAVKDMYPCYDVCQATLDQCEEYLPFPVDCESFPKQQPCFSSRRSADLPVTCTDLEYACVDGGCVDLSKRCDGKANCDDYSDEMNCIVAVPHVYVDVKYWWYPLSTTGFTDQHAQTACRRLGYGELIEWKSSFLDHSATPYCFRLTKDTISGDVSILGQGEITKECFEAGVELKCKPAECGFSDFHPDHRVKRIIGGHDAVLGRIPWQASLQYLSVHFCGASLINHYFVFTAAHCFNDKPDIRGLRVVMGTVDLKEKSHLKRTVAVKRVALHPGWTGSVLDGNDVALVELKEKVDYNDVIQPLCLSQKDDVISPASRCYAAGWGATDGEDEKPSSKLQMVELPLWKREECNSPSAWDGAMGQTEICAGYHYSTKTPCIGDSGGPLFCLAMDRRWRLMGVASYVQRGCTNVGRPTVFANASLYTEWIGNSTVCKFECGNGRCLYDVNMVCDKKDDCGDGTDEDWDLCGMSVSCTFDDPYLCGYHGDWLWAFEALPTHNRYPLFDHTVGRYPGMFLLGAFKHNRVNSPKIHLTSPHCFRFRYHMRGTVRHGMKVEVVRPEKMPVSGRTVWRSETPEGPDQWLLGQFDLSPGVFQLKFAAEEPGVFTLDDTLLLPGSCRDHKCMKGEFACKTKGLFNCLPDGVRCNVVIDCDEGDDERDCDAAVYTCDFENGLLCGLRQDSHDSMNAEWRLHNMSRAGFDDVTFADGTGYMLLMKTEDLRNTDFVRMHHDLYLGGQGHCLTFTYRSNSTARMEVTFRGDSSEDAKTLWSTRNVQTQGWVKVQSSLPAAVQGHLTYTVIGGDTEDDDLHPTIAIDDIHIAKGHCED